MIVSRRFIIFSTILSASFLLSACGEGDSGTASAPAAPAMESAPAPASEGTTMGNMEKADGVVYEDEIYANWPYN